MREWLTEHLVVAPLYGLMLCLRRLFLSCYAGKVKATYEQSGCRASHAPVFYFWTIFLPCFSRLLTPVKAG